MSFEPRQAEDHIDAPRVHRIAVGSVVVFLLAVAAAALLLGVFSRVSPAKAFGATSAASAAPATIGTVEQTLVLATKRGLDDKARDEKALGDWGWVDRDAGVARIPIDRAIDLYVAEESDGGAP